jgi:hypothetical protein
MKPIKTMSARPAKTRTPIIILKPISPQLLRGVLVTHGIEVPRVFQLVRIIASPAPAYQLPKDIILAGNQDSSRATMGRVAPGRSEREPALLTAIVCLHHAARNRPSKLQHSRHQTSARSQVARVATRTKAHILGAPGLLLLETWEAVNRFLNPVARLAENSSTLVQNTVRGGYLNARSEKQNAPTSPVSPLSRRLCV